MSDWTFKDLEKWDDKICNLARSYDLDWFPINYEVCDYYEMIGHMSYHGLPSHYGHWSFGKSFERTHQMYNLGAEGLPYELIINSNPSIAYLMKQNPLYLQILIMAHCVGHSDFFKNNRIFKDTRAETSVTRFRNASKRIREYSENTNIGLKRVENFLDSVHAIKFQTERNGIKRLSKKSIKDKRVRIINDDKSRKNRNINLDKYLLEPDYDLLSFLIEYGSHFKDWQLDILNIVRDESQYFIPQIKTKILNEGWASFWHYKLMNELDLPQEYHIPFLKSHNQVVQPHTSRINPYNVGFYLFQKIEKEQGLDECFFIREVHDDVSAIRFYLGIDDFRELNLFSYSTKKDSVTIDEISDEPGWTKVRESFLKNIGMNSIPRIFVSDSSTQGRLILKHDHDGRDLDLEYANNVIDHVRSLWPVDVKFFTIVEEESWEI
jgi:stage V sporulation protein R